MKFSPDPSPVKWPGTVIIAIACGALYFLQLVFQYGLSSFFDGRDVLTPMLILGPAQDASVLYRMLTYGFIHGSIWHVLFNMVVLAFTAKAIEEYTGRKNFLILYFCAVYFCGIFTALHSAFIRESTVLGASGAISALLFIYWRMNPDAQVLLFFIIPLPIKYLMYALVTLDFFGTIFPLNTGLAHATHFSGYLFGYLYLRYWERFMEWRDGWQERRRLRVVRMEEAKVMSRRSYYANEVDPILKKISEKGMDNLSDIEKEILKRAGKTK
jgi:membrane associated rhomboid family serine protease